MSKKIILLLFFVAVSSSALQAQSADDVLRYSLEYPSYDPVSLVIPAVSQPTGFGAFQDNPAVMALYDKSFFSFDLSNRFIDETSQYLGNSSSFSTNQTNIGDLGFVYKVPTTRGSLVVGGGYSQTTDFNRGFSANGRNNQTTITDFYNITSDDSLFAAAFDVYALDYGIGEDSTEIKSIFRIGLPQYLGINQEIEMTEKGRMGEYSVFLATELFKNFSVGASIGYLSGSYTYHREFLEADRQNDYNGQVVDSDGDGDFETDIDQILSVDHIEADIEAFSARLGFVYQPTEMFNFAASYELPSKLFINESYNTKLTTTFDNSVQFQADAPGRFSYKIVRPQRLKAGITVKSLSGVTLSASAEGIKYSDAEIQFDELSLNDQERDINSTVRSNFNDVINLRAGLEFKVNSYFTPRLGYGYFPSPQEGADSERQFINGGFSSELTKGLIFDLGVQYSFWEDQNVLYSTATTSEVVQEEVTRLHVMVGLRMTL